MGYKKSIVLLLLCHLIIFLYYKFCVTDTRGAFCKITSIFWNISANVGDYQVVVEAELLYKLYLGVSLLLFCTLKMSCLSHAIGCTTTGGLDGLLVGCENIR
uniref:Uncharacterized protein n=1 Tax=Rhizophagus irregularis (strain DAOM 181602 / DAOM 197198 / MUCL 43194) TaxID=747089 RepID=U9TI71_RHIID